MLEPRAEQDHAQTGSVHPDTTRVSDLNSSLDSARRLIARAQDNAVFLDPPARMTIISFFLSPATPSGETRRLADINRHPDSRFLPECRAWSSFGRRFFVSFLLALLTDTGSYGKRRSGFRWDDASAYTTRVPSGLACHEFPVGLHCHYRARRQSADWTVADQIDDTSLSWYDVGKAPGGYLVIYSPR